MRINIGDVGFIRGGQFHLLFSAGCPLGDRRLGEDVPNTFEELYVGTPVFSQPRLPGCLRTDTAGLGATVSAALCVLSLFLSSTYLTNVSPSPLEPGVQFSFELTATRGAALVTKYPTYREGSLLAAAFKEYTKRHYESWVTFARHKKYGNNVQPVLVCGFDMTRDFTMVVYSNEGASLESDLSIAVPMLASASASVWGTWRTRCSPIIRTGTGPYDFGSGDNGGDAFPKLAAESDVEPTASGDEDLSGQWDPNIDDTDSEPDIVAPQPFVSTLTRLQDEENDSWGAIADYIFQVIPSPYCLSVTQPS